MHDALIIAKAKAAAHVELRRNREAGAAYIIIDLALYVNPAPCSPCASYKGRPQQRGGPDGANGASTDCCRGGAQCRLQGHDHLTSTLYANVVRRSRPRGRIRS